MSNELEEFAAHQNQLERDRQQQAHALEVERERTKQLKVQARKDTKETITWITLAALGVGLVLGFVYIIWQATAGPSAGQEFQDKWRHECIERGGTWVPNDYEEKSICALDGTPVIVDGEAQ